MTAKWKGYPLLAGWCYPFDEREISAKILNKRNTVLVTLSLGNGMTLLEYIKLNGCLDRQIVQPSWRHSKGALKEQYRLFKMRLSLTTILAIATVAIAAPHASDKQCITTIGLPGGCCSPHSAVSETVLIDCQGQLHRPQPVE